MPDRLQPESPVAARVIPSPNHGERKGGRRPGPAPLHYTGMPDEDEALRWLCDPRSEVSAHYVVFENGHVAQLVPEARRAWHAGGSSWAGETDVNSCSIGIEIANPGHDGGLPPFGEAQIEGVIALCRGHRGALARSAPDRVLAHSDVAPGRKQDPGERFPWERLHEAGVGHWVRPAPIRDGRFFVRGGPVSRSRRCRRCWRCTATACRHRHRSTRPTEAVVAAFQRHFRPERVDGVADASTITTLRDLIAARPAAVG